MRRPGLVLLVFVALVLASFAPAASATLDRPRYATGDFWRYTSSLTEPLGLRFEGSTTLDAGDLVSIDIQGETVSARAFLLSGGGTVVGDFEGLGTIAGEWTVTGTEHWETGEWNSVRSFARITANGVIEGGPAPVPFSLDIVNETTRRILADSWTWPLEPGETGSTTARWNGSQTVTVQFGTFAPETNASSLDGVFTTRFAHVRTETIAVPAGTFEAYVVRVEGPEGGHRLRWLSARAGAAVRQEEFNGSGVGVATTELKEFRYQAGESVPFPWLLVLVASLAAVAATLGVLLAVRRRPPPDVWMPPTPEEPTSPPDEPKGSP